MSVSNLADLSNPAPVRSPSTADAVLRIEAALGAVDGWLVRNQFAGYEPFDGLNSRLLRPLTFGSKLGRQILVQAVKRSPINIRPYIGIRPETSTKGMGFLARGYLRWHKLRLGPEHGHKARACLDWLRRNASSVCMDERIGENARENCRERLPIGSKGRSKAYSGLCWGNHFDYQTRTYYLASGEPTVVWSALIGQAFIDSYELSGDARDLDAAAGVANFIVCDLPRFTDAEGTCIGYVTHAGVWVHNANALAAGFLARLFGHRPRSEFYEVARAAMSYTAGHQNRDGSWFYGEQRNLHWIDNWHTAYVLDSLDDYQAGTGDDQFAAACARGWRFYFDHFFLPDGCPKYYSNHLYPIDIQCASQSIETLCRFAPHDERALPAAVRVALWTIDNMQDRTGYFHFQRTRHYVNRTPCFHWGQATMLSALALLLLNLQSPHPQNALPQPRDSA